jgi:hypothetical protein
MQARAKAGGAQAAQAAGGIFFGDGFLDEGFAGGLGMAGLLGQGLRVGVEPDESGLNGKLPPVIAPGQGASRAGRAIRAGEGLVGVTSRN